MPASFTKISKVFDGKVSLGVSDILTGSLTVDGGSLPEAMSVDYRAGYVYWTDQNALGNPGPYTFAGQHRTPEETRLRELPPAKVRESEYHTDLSFAGVLETIDAMIERIAESTVPVDLDTDSDPRTVAYRAAVRDKIAAAKSSYPDK